MTTAHRWRTVQLSLLATVTALALDLVRASGPMLDHAFSFGVVTVGVIALVTYLLPGPLAWLLLVWGRRGAARAVPWAVALLVAVRLVLQAMDGQARFVVGLLAVAVAVAALVLCAAAVAAGPGGGTVVAGGLVAGGALSLGTQTLLGTWDPLWRPGLSGWLVPVLLCAAAVGCVLAARQTFVADGHPARRVAVVGLHLGLSAMILANPAFVAAQLRAGLWWGIAVLTVGTAAAVWAVLAAPANRLTRLTVLLVLLGALTCIFASPAGSPATVALTAAAVVLAQVGSGLAVRWALTTPVASPAGSAATAASGTTDDAAAATGDAAATTPQPPTPENGRRRGRPRLRLAGAAGAAGLGVIVPLLVYQLDYDVPLGMPNSALVVGAGLIMAAAGLRMPDHWAAAARPTGTATPGAAVPAGTAAPADPALSRLPLRATAPALLTAALLVAATAAAAVVPGRGGQQPAPPGPEITVVSWNLHYGVAGGPDVPLDVTAAAIADQSPDVVLLQEVSRGWVLGGGADMLHVLADALGLDHVAFAPAADRQFGNAILSAWPLQDVEALRLPYGQGPQQRSAVSATLTVQTEDGPAPLRLTSVHLQHRETNTPTRLNQLDVLLTSMTGSEVPRVLAGDLNAVPGSSEIAMVLRHGFVSAQDEVGDPEQNTSPSEDPAHRIDWVFGRGVTFTGLEVLTEVTTSDHLPLVATLVVAEP